MWPTDDVWMNALMLAVSGSALILAAALGSVLGRSEGGRKILKAAPIALCLLVGVYVAAAMHGQSPGRGKDCIYANAHPSDC